MEESRFAEDSGWSGRGGVVDATVSATGPTRRSWGTGGPGQVPSHEGPFPLSDTRSRVTLLSGPGGGLSDREEVGVDSVAQDGNDHLQSTQSREVGLW